MKLNNIWALLSRRSVIDKESNNISIYDVLEQLEIGVKITKQEETPQEIKIPIEYEVVCLWKRESKENKLTADLIIEIINPKGKTIKEIPQTIEVPAGMRRLRSVMRIMGFVASIPGDYLYRIKVKEEGQKEFRTAAEIPLEVHLKKTVVN